MDKLEIELAKERSEHERVRSELAEVESECREARVHNHSLTIGLETANLTVAKLENQVTSLKYQISQEHDAKRIIGECPWYLLGWNMNEMYILSGSRVLVRISQVLNAIH